MHTSFPPSPSSPTRLQFRRQKSSAVSKLRRFIIKHLLSFTKPACTNQIQTGVDPETGTEQMEDPGTGTEPEEGNEDEAMETELVIDMNGQGEAKVTSCKAGQL